MYLRLFVIIVFLFYSFQTFAKSKVAVLIANQNYAFAQNLKTPIREIDSLQRICSRNNFKTFVFKDFSNESSFNAIFDSIEKVLEPGTLLYVHYSGHGIQIDGENFLVPTDANPHNAAQASRQCFSINKLMNNILIYHNNYDIKTLICIDACRDNPFTELSSNELHYNFKRSEYNLPVNTGIIYSCPPGQTTYDGNTNFSVFASVWIEQIQKCYYDINEFCGLLDGELLKIGLSEDHLPEKRFIGLKSVYFCSEQGQQIKNNLKEKINLLHDLENGVRINYSKHDYSSVILKLNWIDSLCESYYQVKSSISDSDFLEFEILKAISYFNLNDTSCKTILENVWKKLKINFKNSDESNVFDTYYYLSKIYSDRKLWSELYNLRLEFLKFATLTNKKIEAIQVYDNISADFDHQHKIDSALVYSKKAGLLADAYKTNSVYDAFTIETVYRNEANFYHYIDDYTNELKCLMKCYSINKSFQTPSFDILYSLSNYYLNPKIGFNFDSSSKYIEEYKRVFRGDTLVSNICNSELQVNYFQNLNYSDSVDYYLKNFFDGINRFARIIPQDNGIQMRNFGNGCLIPYWNILVISSGNVVPVLFLDANLNSVYDTCDFILSPELVESNIHVLQRYSQFSDQDSASAFVFLKNTVIIPDAGVTQIRNNSFNDFKDSILTPKALLDNSEISFHSAASLKVWNFSICMSDLSLKGLPKYLLGIRVLDLNDDFFNYHDECLSIIPSSLGANYLHGKLAISKMQNN